MKLLCNYWEKTILVVFLLTYEKLNAPLQNEAVRFEN